MTDEQFHAEHRRKGFPWCDTCGRSAVWSETWGNLHVTPDFPHGVPQRLDRSGHDVTFREWNATPRPGF